jgi:hypothetical protein
VSKTNEWDMIYEGKYLPEDSSDANSLGGTSGESDEIA